MGVGVRFPLNDLPGPPVHAAGVISEHALNLCRRHGQAKRTAHLLRDLIQAADHAQLQAPAGGGVGDPVIQAHQVHRPASDVRQNDGRLVQQLRLGQHGGVALGEQGHLRDSDGVRDSLEAKEHGPAVPEEVGPEFLLVPPKAGEGKPCRQMDGGCGVRLTAGQLLGDGGEGQEVVVIRQGFVLLERLAAAAHHIELAVILQHILLGIRLMLVLHQPGGEGNMGAFHGGAYGQGIAHRDSPRFRCCCRFCSSLCFRSLHQGAIATSSSVSIKPPLLRQTRTESSPWEGEAGHWSALFPRPSSKRLRQYSFNARSSIASRSPFRRQTAVPKNFPSTSSTPRLREDTLPAKSRKASRVKKSAWNRLVRSVLGGSAARAVRIALWYSEKRSLTASLIKSGSGISIVLSSRPRSVTSTRREVYSFSSLF